ncbi:AI-2E family transporter YdiK [Ramlibacter solisilvae]|uniref:AI-2E family transporter YdiK n=1 Tax=Ramlibacter tataouinensis TaxID=94132 RepID=A0A127JVD6_9BURK|nr:AI-2E family transporter YdiK [Ramlibacter tataouinensis]AMO23881.1 hypothetical protein UC35_14670 [Ramlibacter tataouinensis]
MTPVTNLPRVLMSILAIGGLLLGTLWVVQPFIGPGIWAVTIVAATWPLFKKLQAILGGSRFLAVTAMTLMLLAIIVVPLFLAVDTLLDQSDRLVSLVREMPELRIPPPPAWVQSIPLAGARIAQAWLELAETAPDVLAGRLEPYAAKAVVWLGSQAGSVGLLLFYFVAMLIIAVILYATGEVAARGVMLFFRRLAGVRGEESVVLAGQAIRAVALGVIVTALVQSTVAALGMLVVGIPQVGLLTALIFILCIAQLGPFLVMVPGVVWLYWSGSPGRGTVFLVWTVVVLAMDNVLRPWLIQRGANLPLLLIFAGVIGGLLSFGVIGLFIGPVILAVSYTLLKAWVLEVDHPAAVPPRPAAPAESDAPDQRSN